MPATQRFSEPYYSASRSTFHHLTGHQLRIRGLPVLTRIGTFAAPGPYIKTTKRLVADLTTKPISRLARSMQIPSGSLRSPPPCPLGQVGSRRKIGQRRVANGGRQGRARPSSAHHGLPPTPQGPLGVQGAVRSRWGHQRRPQRPVGLGALGDRLSRSVSFASVLS